MNADEAMAEARRVVALGDPLEPIGSHGVEAMAALVAEVERLRAAETYFTERDRAEAWQAGAEAMRGRVKTEIHAAFHYRDPPDDGVSDPIIAARCGEWESHEVLRQLLSRVCVMSIEGGSA